MFERKPHLKKLNKVFLIDGTQEALKEMNDFAEKHEAYISNYEIQNINGKLLYTVRYEK